MANTPLQYQRPILVLWVWDTDGTVLARCASVDVDDTGTIQRFMDLWALAADSTATFPGYIKNADAIRVIEDYSDAGGGIMAPSTATVILANGDGWFNRATEWRGKRALLGHYEQSTLAGKTLLTGIIADVDHLNSQTVLTLSTHDPSIWDMLIPRRTIAVDEFPSATDMGTPIPVVFGPCFVSVPYCGLDEDNDPGGHDFLISHQVDQDDASLNVRVERVFFDTSTDNPGLEEVSAWDEAPGTPTYASGTTFTVTGNQGMMYFVGASIRAVTTASAGAWQYGRVTDYTTGTVTVAGITLDSGINTGGGITQINPTPTAGGTGYTVGDILTVTTGGSNGKVVVTRVASGVVTKLAISQPGKSYTTGTGKATSGGTGSGCTVNIVEVMGVQLTGEYLVETSRYATGGDNLVSLRMLGNQTGGVVVQANSDLTNPTSVIKEIMRNSLWGLGQTANATSFATAVTAMTTAGLGTCIAYALGGDRQQRRAGEVVRELLALRGGKIWKDASTGEWMILWDSAPAAAVWTFGYGDGAYNNIKRVVTNAGTPLAEAVSTLKLKFGISARLKSSTDYGITYVPGAYQFEIQATVLGVGSERTITNPWIRTTAAAARQLSYIAKTLQAGDRKPVIVTGEEGRNVNIGELVRYTNGPDVIDTDFRVVKKESRLADHTLWLQGYNATTYTYSTSDTTLVSDSLDWDDQQAATGSGANLIINSDFSAGIKSATLATDMVPAMRLFGRDGLTIADISAVSIDIDAKYVGGAALLVTTTANWSAANNGPLLVFGMAQQNLGGGGTTWGTPIIEGELYMVSIYMLNSNFFIDAEFFGTGMGGGGTWQPVMRNTYSRYRRSPLRERANDGMNGAGWKRYYTIIRAPVSSNPAVPYQYARFGAVMMSAGDYGFDALQVEQISRGQSRPSQYKRFAKWGVDPALLQPGSLTIRLPGEAEHGTVVGHETATVNTTSGASVSATNIIPAGVVVQGVTTRQSNVTGPTTINIGTAADPYAWGEGVAVANGTTTTASDFTVVNPPTFPAATDVVIQAVGGAFTGGSIVVTVHYLRFVAPTG